MRCSPAITLEDSKYTSPRTTPKALLELSGLFISLEVLTGSLPVFGGWVRAEGGSGDQEYNNHANFLTEMHTYCRTCALLLHPFLVPPPRHVILCNYTVYCRVQMKWCFCAAWFNVEYSENACRVGVSFKLTSKTSSVWKISLQTSHERSGPHGVSKLCCCAC